MESALRPVLSLLEGVTFIVARSGFVIGNSVVRQGYFLMKEKLSQFLNASKTQLFLYPVLAGICLPLGFERYRIFPILFLLPLFFHGMRKLPLKKKIIAYWLFASRGADVMPGTLEKT